MTPIAHASGNDGGMRPHRLTLFAVPAALATLALLAGCGPTKTVDPGTTSTPSPSATATATPTPKPSADAVDGIPIALTCEQIIPAQAMYEFNENFTPKDSYVPAAGTLGAKALAQNGLACAWVHNSNGDLIELSVADIPEPALTTLKNDTFSTSNSVPTYVVEGYFLVEAGIGVAQAFPGEFWIVLSSPVFFEPGDAEPLMRAAISALG